MCRYNLILVKDNKVEDQLLCEGYGKFIDKLNGYTAYQKGYCNCDSFVGSLIGKKGMGYKEAITTVKREKLERLYQMKELMTQPDYQQRKEEFLHNQMQYMKEQPDFLLEDDQYRSFMKENELMQESTYYYRTVEEQLEQNPGVLPLPELYNSEDLSLEDDENMIIVEEESRVIDDVVYKAENETDQDNLDEFDEHKRIFSELLKSEETVMFATIWSEAEELIQTKTISLDKLKIDDLAFLDYNEMIGITKQVL